MTPPPQGHRQYYQSNMWFKDRRQRTLTHNESTDGQKLDQRLEKEPDNMEVDSNPLQESEACTDPGSTTDTLSITTIDNYQENVADGIGNVCNS